MTKTSMILIDYENLYNAAANNHQLKMTEMGFEHLVQHYTSKYNVEDEMVFVACVYEDYAGLSSLVEGLSFTPIRTMEKGPNMTDGYLIAYGMNEIQKNKDKIDQLILIAGDGIYSGLTRVATSLLDKVVISFWEKSTSEKLKKVNKKRVEIEHIEDLFNLEEKTAEGWFESYGLTTVEKEIISFLNGKELEYGFQVDALANQMIKWTNPAVVEQFGGNFYDVKNYLFTCATNSGFLIKERAPSPRGDKDVWWVKLNRSHLKVVNVLGDQ